MDSQLFLPAGWARHLEILVHPTERLVELEKDRAAASREIREILERLAQKHGATPGDLAVAAHAVDNALSDLLSDRDSMLQHETAG